ncbi:hypothetical protein MtrunA17_Chr4g0041911 [Medicago truncatula]|uniref:Uncharacterized protein n=1 Tax=Medicago truncatula TaxID=3880 RepID=A0A396IGF9_MEDTR|nr:hypothetical protein MtrunA17_Chr4g0041911 [Medicago truncatula]
MQDANVMPDSQTFRYLVGICETEDDINKYYEELMQSGIRPYYMSLIRDAAACWELEKAKQV